MPHDPRQPLEHRLPHGIVIKLQGSGHPDPAIGWVNPDAQVPDILVDDIDVDFGHCEATTPDSQTTPIGPQCSEATAGS